MQTHSPTRDTSTPYLAFSSKVKLISSGELIGTLGELASNQKIVRGWDIRDSVRNATQAGTHSAADCLIIGGKSPDGSGLKNLYHIAPVQPKADCKSVQEFINPKQTAQTIANELRDLSQTNGKALDVIIAAGDFKPPIIGTFFNKNSTEAPKTTRAGNSRALFDALTDTLGDTLSKHGLLNNLSTMAGRKRGYNGYTGLITKPNDPDWHVNVIYGANYQRHNGIVSHDAVGRTFEEVNYMPAWR